MGTLVRFYRFENEDFHKENLAYTNTFLPYKESVKKMNFSTPDNSRSMMLLKESFGSQIMIGPV